MQPLFGKQQKENESRRDRAASTWPTSLLGFIGGAIICWIVLGVVTPISADARDVVWITNTWVKIAITSAVALIMAALLPSIEGTTWGTYYVIIGYLLSLGLIVWIVLRLLRYV